MNYFCRWTQQTGDTQSERQIFESDGMEALSHFQE
jgi:hypothetical protein